jgi:hypothetical protein
VAHYQNPDPGPAAGMQDAHGEEMLAGPTVAELEVLARAALLKAAIADGVALAEHPAGGNLEGIGGDGPDEVDALLEDLEGAVCAGGISATFLGAVS